MKFAEHGDIPLGRSSTSFGSPGNALAIDVVQPAHGSMRSASADCCLAVH